MTVRNPRRWRNTFAVLFVLFAAAATFVFAGAALSDQDPGWEPEANVLGTISFYDKNGMQVVGGDLSQRPAAFYAVASGAGRPGDSLAQLKIFTPREGVAPLLWSGDTLTGSTNYPATGDGVPANIAHMTLPVVTATEGDLSMADYYSEFPNASTTPGYQNLYELRLYTSAPGVNQNVAYFRVDIRFTILTNDGNGNVTGTWDVVYPPSAVTTGGGPASPTPTPSPSPTPTPTPTPTVSVVTTTVTETVTTAAAPLTTVTSLPTTAGVAPTTAAAIVPPAVVTTPPTAAATSDNDGAITIPPPSASTVYAEPSDEFATVGGTLTLASHSTSLATVLGLGLTFVVVAIVGFIYYYSRRDSGYPNG